MLLPELESTVCSAGDGDAKVSCENLAGAPADDPPSMKPPDDPDFPSESFFVPIDDEVDWVDATSVYYDRDDSTKGNTNPKSQHGHGGGSVVTSKPRSNSLRFSGNIQAKMPIIGLPNVVQHSGYLGRSARFATSARIFPRKPAGGGSWGRKSAVPDQEPSSPKVSCIGKVLSQRELRRRNHREGSSEVKKSEPEPTEKIGCWAGISGAFRCYSGCVAGGKESPTSSASPPLETRGKATKRLPSPEKLGAASEPPALGAMKRFASGRKSAMWEEEVPVGAVGDERSTA